MNSFHQIKNRLREGLNELYEACCAALACLEEGDLSDAAWRKPDGLGGAGKISRLARPGDGARTSPVSGLIAGSAKGSKEPRGKAVRHSGQITYCSRGSLSAGSSFAEPTDGHRPALQRGRTTCRRSELRVVNSSGIKSLLRGRTAKAG